MEPDRSLFISPRLELFFALAAVLRPGGPWSGDEAAARGLDQARRKLDQSFRRRLGDLAEAPEVWHRLATLPLPDEADDADGVIEALAALPPDAFAAIGAADPDTQEALQRAVVDALRRFDRIAFAGLWRAWREEIAGDAPALESRLRACAWRDLGWAMAIDSAQPPAFARFLPSRFAPAGFVARTTTGALLIPFDPEKLPRAAARSTPASRPATALDPALAFRALGDATRYAIAGLIARSPMTGAELARRLGTATPTVTHHLKLMRAAGLIAERRQGNSVLVSLDRGALERLSPAAVRSLFDAPETPIRRSRRSAVRNRAASTRGPHR